MEAIPKHLNDMQAADLTQLLRESVRRLREVDAGAAQTGDCRSLADRIEQKLIKFGVDLD